MTTTTPPPRKTAASHGASGIDGHECARAWTLLRSVYTRINARLEEEFGRQLGITMHEFEVLLCVGGAKPGQVRLGDLQAASPLSQPALSRLVARLEGQGLLGRRETDADRRVVLLSTTDAGRDLLERSVRLHAEIIHAMLVERLTDDEQRHLVQTLSRVRGPDPATG